MASSFSLYSAAHQVRQCIAGLLIALPLIALPCWPTVARGDSLAKHAPATVTFESAEYGFRIEYPADQFREVKVQHPSVALALQSRDRPYPTFNITVEPGRYTPASEQVHVEGILAAYRQVGLTDATLLKLLPQRSHDGDLPWPGVQIAYSNQGQKLQSVVTTIAPTEPFHLILTYIDEGVESSQTATGSSALVQAFSLTAKEAAPPASSSGYSTLSLWIILCLLALGVGAIRLRRSQL